MSNNILQSFLIIISLKTAFQKVPKQNVSENLA